MFNLHRASQMRFPDEDLLEDAWNYTRFHLEEKQQQPHLSDRWVVSKDLRGELEYALNWPWYASFPRLETRAYIDQYGPDDVWIAKSLYRLVSCDRAASQSPQKLAKRFDRNLCDCIHLSQTLCRMYGVCNSAFLSLAKADFNVCQNMYRAELEALKEYVDHISPGSLQSSWMELEFHNFVTLASCLHFFPARCVHVSRWVSECRFDRLRFARHHTVIPGFLCSASTSFEPEMAAVRRARTQFMFLATMADDYTTLSGAPQEELDRFQAATQKYRSHGPSSTTTAMHTTGPFWFPHCTCCFHHSCVQLGPVHDRPHQPQAAHRFHGHLRYRRRNSRDSMQCAGPRCEQTCGGIGK